MSPDTPMADGEREDEVDPVLRLRAANPVSPGAVDTLATTARARALRAELTTMQTDAPSTDAADAGEPAPGTDHVNDTAPQRRWRRGVLAGTTLVALALGSAALIMGLAGTAPRDVVADDTRVDPESADGELPADTPADPAADDPMVDPMPGGMALCAVMYSPETLVERELVFVGTVLTIEGDAISFEVEEVLKGEPGDRVQLGGAEFLTTPNPDNVNPVAVGDRLLVAGDGGFAWGCGFTHPYDEDVAAQWRAAFD